MGNRAVITFDTTKSAPCIYLHWNGGRCSVEGFLNAAKALGLREVEAGKEAEALDWIAETLAKNFFNCEVGMTVYRETYGSADCDNGDNGVYVLNRTLDIVGRKFKRGPEDISPDKTAGIEKQILSTAERYPGEKIVPYLVVCLDDDRKMVLARSAPFESEEAAKAYAATVSPARLPQVFKAA